MVDVVDKKRKKSSILGKAETYDPRTGEVLDVMLLGLSNEFTDKNFTKVFHAFTKALIQDEDIAGKAIRLLFWILDQLKYGSIEFYMYPEDISKEIKVSRATVYNWIKILTDKNIIRKIKPNLYQINPACVAYGQAHSLINEWNKPIK